MSKKPKSVEVKVYNVGLGDCILLTFHTTGGKPNAFRVLVDYGSTGKNPDSPESIDIAKQIIADCKDGNGKPRLDALIATHRHLDHLSGFGGKTGELLEAQMRPPRLLMQPWTEDPKADNPAGAQALGPGAAFMLQSMQQGQAVVSSVLEEIAARRGTALGRATDDEVWFYGRKNLPPRKMQKGTTASAALASTQLGDSGDLAFSEDAINTDELTNRDALERFDRWRSKQGCRSEFVEAGQATKLDDMVPGLKTTILGPAGPDHWNHLKKHGGSEEFWARLAGLRSDSAMAKLVEFSSAEGPYGVPPIFPSAEIVPNRNAREDNIRWMITKLDLLRGQQLLGFVRALDSHLNNTSVVLLLEFGGFKMLFPGDAEVGAWQWINEHGTGDGKPVPDALEMLLKDVDLYKVGHHGSNNATPIQSMWQHLLKNRSDDRPMHCVLSTQWTRFKNKIPNHNLWRAIQDHPDLHLLSTSPPLESLDAGPSLDPAENAGWEVHKSQEGGGKVVAYSRVFDVG